MANRRTLIGVITGVVVAGLVAGVSVLWPGLDARDTPPVDSTLWALQTGDGQHYARVNTAVGELDTVRTAANPSAVALTSRGAFLYSQSFGHITKLNDAMPQELTEDELRTSPATPPGSTDAVVAGDYVAYRTDAGAVFGGAVADQSATQVNPNEPKDDKKAEVPEYTAAAVTVTDAGVLFAYSVGTKAVLRYDVKEHRVLGSDPVTGAGEQVTITAVGDTWFLYDSGSAKLWTRGGAAAGAKLATTGATALAAPTSTGTDTFLADETGVFRLPASGAPKRLSGQASSTLGTPVKPTQFKGVTYAAWLSNDAGTYWRSDVGAKPLDFNGAVLGDTRRLAFVSNGNAMMLNETRKGWVWLMPSGKLVLSSQDWTPKETDENEKQSDVEAKVVLDPKPPVAEADAFGVRPGAITALPVMLNDHDPNEDVLSIDPGSVTGLDPKFGTATVTDNGGRISVNVADGATGSATLSYRVTDGTAADGLFSKPTTVTLTVTGKDQNRAPEWCGVNNCLAKWPQPEVKPGGTVTVPVLTGWVDPDGDPVLLLSASAPQGQGIAAVTASGEVVFQHTNAGETAAATVPVEVLVADTRGAIAKRTLKIRVTPTPQLRAASFALVDAAGADLSVDVAPHVTGTAGDLVVKDVQVQDDADATVNVPVAGTTFDFRSGKAGTYRVRYRVSDGKTETSATVRITLVAKDAPAQLSTGPVVAFLRPQEDATVNVLAAVSNPTRRVLLLSGTRATADAGATLQVDSVGQNFIRVSGTTATGEPGRLGVVDYTVSDGTDDRGSRVVGQASVYLLPPARDLAPIAVDDAVVVRAGAQIDIPVLDNDVAPSGGALVLDPSRVTSSSPDALAFASGKKIRYLAPEKAGSYSIRYAVYTSGSPSLRSEATVRVQVIGAEKNRAPNPPVLEGRVLAGQSIKLPLDKFGADPDGDDVVLERIASQPKRGSAAISADGSGIVYTSSPGSKGGQDTFTYRLRDSQGEAATGTVRVGVLNEESNPSPVTFTDFVQVQAGDDSKVSVRPLDNDIDPFGGKLKLTKVVPNLTAKFAGGASNPEYERWAGLMTRSGKDGLTITAGKSPGTMSFLYDVESESGNTARGLVVVKVVRETVPDFPIVRDTVLTTENRDDFVQGVDVLSNRVTWSGGDPATLNVGLWNDTAGVTVRGSQLQGTLKKKSQIIPFAVKGRLPDGKDFTTYAFLRVPAEDDVTISLRAGLAPQQVKEKEAVTFDMHQIVAMPRDAVLEVDSRVRTGGARKDATCSVTGTRVTYTAAEGAPWVDVCVVPVRVEGQKDWTYLSVPIEVTALAPVPVLRSASLTIEPGSKSTFDLESITSWQGRSDAANLRYEIEPPGNDFTVEQNGKSVSITAKDTALPGRESSVVVKIVSHPNVAPSRLMLRVGPPPSTLPQAGTVAQKCTQASGNSCTIQVTGAPGEVNPFPSTPLKLVSVAPSGACAGISYEVVNATTVRASWGNDTPGATCAGSFVLEDAQGRTTSGDRQGKVLLDLQGFPGTPGSVVESTYDDGKFTLQVAPGAAAASYPALTGFSIRRGGTEVAKCSADGVCGPISAPNGEKRTYTAFAVNAVGASRGSVSTEAWAFATPSRPSVSAVPIRKGPEGNWVRLSITGIDTVNAKQLRISAPGAQPVTPQVSSESTTLDYNVGSNTQVEVSVAALSPFDIPPGTGTGEKNGKPGTTQANGIGAPTDVKLTVTSTPTGPSKATVTLTASSVSGGDGSDTLYKLLEGSKSCSTWGSDWGSESTRTITNADANVSGAQFTVCAKSVYKGDDYYTTGPVVTSADIPGAAPDPTGSYTFKVGAVAKNTSDTHAEWLLDGSLFGPGAPSGYRLSPKNGDVASNTFGEDPQIFVSYVSSVFDNVRSANPVKATPRSGSAPYQVQATWSVKTCTAGAPLVLDPGWSGTEQPKLEMSLIRYYGANGQLILPADPANPQIVPAGTEKVTSKVSVSWPTLPGLNTYFGGSVTGDCS